ncbi:VQ domain containing protein [Musa troglodytarum]|uniref:VQ domain containing protein n=1 Tax=Musa troglodytarum TaxID=320322 RepID=A0A9E7GAL8_9LILI|nr:VQ domain containing protein [Musa troglodytarum]
MSSDHVRRPLKVRVIVTKCVQADAVQFKSVVQCLTRKDSVAEMSESPGGRGGSSHEVERGCGGGRKRPISAEQEAGRRDYAAAFAGRVVRVAERLMEARDGRRHKRSVRVI